PPRSVGWASRFRGKIAAVDDPLQPFDVGVADALCECLGEPALDEVLALADVDDPAGLGQGGSGGHPNASDMLGLLGTRFWTALMVRRRIRECTQKVSRVAK